MRASDAKRLPESLVRCSPGEPLPTVAQLKDAIAIGDRALKLARGGTQI
jgi:hypothetical protein